VPSASSGRRSERVAQLLQRHLAAALQRELDDPRLAAAVISRVEVSDDLTIAKIWMRLLVGGEAERERRGLIERLKRAAVRLRRLLAPRLDLKRAPELRFFYDTGPDAHDRVAELLREVASDEKPGEGGRGER
jgi:ribosome-binding factor A